MVDCGKGRAFQLAYGLLSSKTPTIKNIHNENFLKLINVFQININFISCTEVSVLLLFSI